MLTFVQMILPGTGRWAAALHPVNAILILVLYAMALPRAQEGDARGHDGAGGGGRLESEERGPRRHRVLVTRPDPPGPRRHHRLWMPCIVRVSSGFRRAGGISARTMVWSGQDLLFRPLCPTPHAGGWLGGSKCGPPAHRNDYVFHAAAV